jgi:hypothetical protein
MGVSLERFTYSINLLIISTVADMASQMSEDVL